MTATTPTAPPASTRALHGRLTFLQILNSEWIKLRSLRSTVWSYLTVVAASLGLGALMAMSLQLGGGSFPTADQARLAVQASTFGIFFGQMVVAVLGVLAISGEYSTGMIRSTLTAVPRRLPALWAKAVVLFLVTLFVGAAGSIGAFLVAQPLLAGKGIEASLIDSRVFLPLLGAALYLAFAAVFALGLGTILRSSAGGIAAALGILLLLPIALSMVPAEWARASLPYLISSAGTDIFGLASFGQAALEPWKDILVVVGWVGISLAGAAVLLMRRDA